MVILQISSQWLEFRLGNNSVKSLLLVFLALVLLFLLRRFFSTILSKLLFRLIRKKPQSTAIQTFVTLLTKPIEWLITLVAIYFSITQLDVHSVLDLETVEKPGILMVGKKIFQICLVSSFAFLAARFVDFFALEVLHKQEIQGENQKPTLFDSQLVPFFKELTKIFIWILAFFFGLGFVFELNIANIIAGLGLGGLAVALAAKESLENLFASFTIFLDKPFVVGDLVTVNNITGTIEKVGFRSTRIRTLEKSFLTLPNKVMIDNPLDNLSLRTHRRADMNLSIDYQTSKEKLEVLMETLRAMLINHPRCSEEPVVRFVQFGDSALIIRVLYFVDTLEFYEFMKVREEINLLILEKTREAGCQFAFPTQTLYLRENSEKQVEIPAEKSNFD